MRLQLIRRVFTRESTTGELFVDGKFECYTLEDAVRPIKVVKKTAIPMGRYRVTITHSKRFNRPMPLLSNVPFFEGIRIHSGNCHEDTDGCILVGKTRGEDYIGGSRLAYQALYEKIHDAFKRKEQIMIEVRGGCLMGLEEVAEAHKHIA
jgi:hypothetical protein